MTHTFVMAVMIIIVIFVLRLIRVVQASENHRVYHHVIIVIVGITSVIKSSIVIPYIYYNR